jgi:regulatory protein
VRIRRNAASRNAASRNAALLAPARKYIKLFQFDREGAVKDLDKKTRFQKLKLEFEGSVVGEQKKGRSLRRIAMDFLARREHSEQELRRKLNARASDDGAVDEVLSQLKDEGLQSDERFTEAYVHHRINAGIGPMKLSYELRQKGIDESLADAALEPLDNQWESMMRRQRERKYGEVIPADYAERMKQARFLQNRGFSPESVMRLFR